MQKINVARFSIYVALVTVFVTHLLFADTATVNGITWTYTVSNGKVSLGGGTYSSTAVPQSTKGALTIPSTLDGYPVTSIGERAFYGCSGLTSVTIPDSVTGIGWNAFFDCRGLTSVIMPDSVTSIGGSAFYGCSGLASVTIPDSVTGIGNDAFKNCSQLTSVNINDVAAWCRISFGDGFANPLRYAKKLYINGLVITDIVIPDSVTSIRSSAFSGCSGLTSVTIPDSVTSIGDWAFYGCSGFAGVTIPDSVTSIGSYAFYNCSGLTSVTIGNGVTRIYGNAFEGCSGLTEVRITDIAKWCGILFGTADANPLFYAHKLYLNESIVVNLKIPNGVTSIGASAFYNCSGLTSVTIPSRWALASVFTNSYTKIETVMIPSGSTNIVAGAFKGCGALTSVTIPDTVASIGDEAFYNCSSLQSLSIPDSVTSYGVNCFEGCPAYTLSLYRAIFGGGSGGGSPVVVTTVVQNVEAPYALTGTAADRAIASVTVNSDCSIDSFVLKDGKVYDSMLYVSNTADHEVTLSLPSGHTYKTIKGAKPLTIPASSQCIISITRVAANVFLVMREELDDVQ